MIETIRETYTKLPGPALASCCRRRGGGRGGGGEASCGRVGRLMSSEGTGNCHAAV